MPATDPLSPEKTSIVTNVRIHPAKREEFAEWQGKFNAAIVTFPGFVSLEILSPKESQTPDWMIVQRFDKPESVLSWKNSKEYPALLEQLHPLLYGRPADSISEATSGAFNKGGVTEVFVTEVTPDKEQAFRVWSAKIHQIEAKFPGFRGVYVQSPEDGKGNWITLLQFDTPQHLDKWINSPERKQVLQESKHFIDSLETHRVVSPYAGWFSSISKAGKAPSAIKQTMIVLLVLFPIVMLELKWLSPFTASLNSSLATFIGNAISVSLVSWPMVPLCIKLLGWWLNPEGQKKRQANLFGTLLVIALYLIEIAIFWHLLN